MEQTNKVRTRGTNVELVFDHLYNEINSLSLLPGTRISEADMAARFGVSRQPVRDAFNRLANLELVIIQPQKATVVRKFSNQAITKARFIRSAIEVEVLRRASAECDNTGARRLEKCLQKQTKIVDAEDFDAFHEEDYIFHKTLCEIAGVPYAFEIISDEKAKVDRLCALSLSGEKRLAQLLDDHQQIADNVVQGNAAKATEAGRLHLTRLDETINEVLKNHPEYFED